VEKRFSKRERKLMADVLLAPIGEIMEANTTELTARCKAILDPPAFGSFAKVVEAGELTIFAVVYNTITISTYPGYRPDLQGKTLREMLAEQPQLYDLLATDFSGVIIAYQEGWTVRHYLPPRPPQIHSPVYPCTVEDIRALTQEMHFLRAILQPMNAKVPSDELVAALIRHAAAARGADFDFLVRAGKEVANLLRNDYDRLCSILRRLQG